jgi:Variant SH3 domain
MPGAGRRVPTDGPPAPRRKGSRADANRVKPSATERHHHLHGGNRRRAKSAPLATKGLEDRTDPTRQPTPRGVADKSGAGRRRALTRLESIVRPAETANELLAEVDTWTVVFEVLGDADRVASSGSGDTLLMTSRTDAASQHESLRRGTGRQHRKDDELNEGVPERAVLLGQAVNNDPAALNDVLKRLAAKNPEIGVIRKQLKDLRQAARSAKLRIEKQQTLSEKKLRVSQRDELERYVNQSESEFKALRRDINQALKSSGRTLGVAQNRELAAAIPNSPQLGSSPVPSSPRGKPPSRVDLLPPSDTSLRICWFSSGLKSEFGPLQYEDGADNAARWESQQTQPGVDEDATALRNRKRAMEKVELSTFEQEMKTVGAMHQSDMKLEHEKGLHDLERRQMTKMTDRWLDETLDEQRRGRQYLQEAHQILVAAIDASQRLAETYLTKYIHARQWMAVQDKNKSEKKNAVKELKLRTKDMKRRHATERKGKSKPDQKELIVKQQAELEALAKDSERLVAAAARKREKKLAHKHLEQSEALQFSHRRFLAKRVRKFCSVERRVLRQISESNREHLQNTYGDGQGTLGELQADEAQMLRDEYCDITHTVDHLRDSAVDLVRDEFKRIVRDWAQKSARKQTRKTRSVLTLVRRESTESKQLAASLSQTNFAQLSPDGRRASLPNLAPLNGAEAAPDSPRSPRLNGDDYSAFIHDSVRQCVVALGLRTLRRKVHCLTDKQQRELDVWTEHRQQRLDFEAYWANVFQRTADEHAADAIKLSETQWLWLRKMGLTKEKPEKKSKDERESELQHLLRKKFGISREEIAPRIPDTVHSTARHQKFIERIEEEWGSVKTKLQSRWQIEQAEFGEDIQALISGIEPEHCDSDDSGPATTRRRRKKTKIVRKPVKRSRKVLRQVKTKKMRKREKAQVKVRKTRPTTRSSLPPGVIARCKAVHTYQAKKPEQISLAIGDIVEITRKKQSGWWEGTIVGSGDSGKFPSNFCEELPADECSGESSYSSFETESGSGKDESYSTFTEEEVDTEVDSFTETETEAEDSESAESSSDSEPQKGYNANIRTFSRISPAVLREAQRAHRAELASGDETGGSKRRKSKPKSKAKKATWKPGTQLARESRHASMHPDRGDDDDQNHGHSHGHGHGHSHGHSHGHNDGPDEFAAAREAANSNWLDATSGDDTESSADSLMSYTAVKRAMTPDADNLAKSDSSSSESYPAFEVGGAEDPLPAPDRSDSEQSAESELEPVDEVQDSRSGSDSSASSANSSIRSSEVSSRASLENRLGSDVLAGLADLDEITSAALAISLNPESKGPNEGIPDDLRLDADFSHLGLPDSDSESSSSSESEVAARKVVPAHSEGDMDFWVTFLTMNTTLSPDAISNNAELFVHADMAETDLQVISDALLTSIGVEDAGDRKAILAAAKKA